MKSIILSIAAAFAAAAAAGEKAYLWPEGKMPDAQPHQYAAMTDVSLAKGFKPDEWRAPYIEWFEPEPGVERNGLCAILISGGSYECTCDVSHVAAWKKKLTAMGTVCANLVYRTPRPKGLPIYKTAWEDGQRAVRLVRADADKWAAMNSVKTWEQLRRMGVQGELHTLALRDHGFQRSASPGTGSYTWMDRIWEFMSAKGFNK